MKRSVSIALFLLVLACGAFGQGSPLGNLTLPPFIFAGLSYNQLTGGAGVISGIFPESQGVGLYGSVTADIVPVKTVVNGRTAYLVGGSFRAGQHKKLYYDGKNMLLIGGDLGAAFSGTGSTAGVTIGVAASFTVTYVRQFSPHWGIAVPVRMLYMSGAGPGGAGAWNPVAQVGVVWDPTGQKP